MKMIPMSELNHVLKNKKSDSLILDVRTPEEFEQGHVPGAKNIPHDEVPQRLSEIEGHSEVFIYCRAGVRAQFAACEIQKLGIELICVSSGGMPDWVRLGLPVENH